MTPKQIDVAVDFARLVVFGSLIMAWGSGYPLPAIVLPVLLLILFASSAADLAIAATDPQHEQPPQIVIQAPPQRALKQKELENGKIPKRLGTGSKGVTDRKGRWTRSDQYGENVIAITKGSKNE